MFPCIADQRLDVVRLCYNALIGNQYARKFESTRNRGSPAMDDKTQGTEQQDQLSDMSRDELDAEIGRLLGVYPVVRFLDEREIEGR